MAAEVRAQAQAAKELDQEELQAVAGGKTGQEKRDEYCDDAGNFMCGLGLAVALWSPDYWDD